jgi:uncharacterized surface anchored protein
VDSTTNQPLAGVSVSSTIQAIGEPPKTTGTDGVVKFTDVTPGSYTVTVALRGYNNATSGTFTIQNGETKKITLRIEIYTPPTKLRVTVKDARARSNLLNAVKVFFVKMPSNQPYLELWTTNSGICEFVDIKPGYYECQAIKNGYDEETKSVDVIQGQTTELEIQIRPSEERIPAYPSEAVLLGILLIFIISYMRVRKQ